MSETGKLIDQQQDLAIWNGLQQFAAFPDWLLQARDADRVCQELAKFTPEIRSGRWILKSCDVGHIRYKSDFLSAFYKLIVRKPAEFEDTVIHLQGRLFPPGKLPNGQAHVQGNFGTEEWSANLPRLNLELRTREPETILAALDFLTDPEQSRQFLEKSIRGNSPVYSDLKIKTCNPDVVRYNPGSRCTVVYHLDYEPGLDQSQTWPKLVVAKTYHGEKGRNAFEAMSALWNSALGSGTALGSGNLMKVAEPLAYHPDLKVLIQGPIREERTLKDLQTAAVESQKPETMHEFSNYMDKTAAGLAAIHRSGVKLGQVWRWEDEMAAVQDQVDRLAVALPQLGMACAPLLQRLNQLAAETPADPPVPSHGTFRPAQVLLYQGEIGFIDFDSFCQSEPANDLALFLGTVMTISLTSSHPKEQGDGNSAASSLNRQNRFDLLSSISEKFLDEYARHHPVSRQRVALWEALDIFTFVIHGWTKIKVHEIEDIIFLLEQFLITNGLVGAL